MPLVMPAACALSPAEAAVCFIVNIDSASEKLYQEENYNPMSGCLPMLIQFPILFGLIDVIYKPMSHILRIGQEVLSQAYTIAAPILDVAPEMLSKDMTAQLKVMGAVQQNPQAFASLGDFVDKVNSINLTIGVLYYSHIFSEVPPSWGGTSAS